MVFGDVRTKAEVDDGHHVLCWKRGDLLWLQYGRVLQSSKAFAGQFDQVSRLSVAGKLALLGNTGKILN